MRGMIRLSAVVLGMLAIALLGFSGQARAVTIDCSLYANVSCQPCCGSDNCVCTDNRECSAGSFLAWNDPTSGKRTGIRFCPEADRDVQVTLFYPDANFPEATTEFLLTPFGGCVNIHLDELNWTPFQPTFDELHFISFGVEVPSGSPVPLGASVLTSRTSDAYNYDIFKVDPCVSGP